MMNINSKIHEECGVVAIINEENIGITLKLSLHILQHRGHESFGMISLDNNGEFYKIKKMGWVGQSLDANALKNFKGNMGIGHVRYSTCGESSTRNIQPFWFPDEKPIVIYAHNGNIVNADVLKKRALIDSPEYVFKSSSDSEIINYLLWKYRKSIRDFDKRLVKVLSMLEGAFSLVLLHNKCIYGCRDNNGLRPLVFGKKEKTNSYMFASEDIALNNLGYNCIRDVEPGEIVKISSAGIIETIDYIPLKLKKHNFCSMEYIYFLRPDSTIEGINAHLAREKMGRQLYRETKIKADIVIGVPDSGISAAIGYSKESNIPYEIGLIKNKYIGRSFIAPSQKERSELVTMKLHANHSVIKGKDVILIDDSIIRGSTMEIIIKHIKKAGAKKIHVMSSSPEFKWPCIYGVDTPTRKELRLANSSIQKYLKDLVYADSLNFLSLDGLQSVLNRYTKKNQLCTTCFTGKYITKRYN